MTRAALYMRISMDRTGEHLGVERQQQDCEEHARALDWDIAELFIDNDISATSGKARPEYRRMLAAVDAGEIDAIVAWHPDRLYRKVPDLGDLVDVCKRNSTQISTVRAGVVDLSTPSGRLIAGLLAQVATYEGEAKADRWQRSWRQGREAGKWAKSGTRLFGYTRAGEVVETEATVARDMARRILEGDSILGVARWLQDEGVEPTRGGAWSPASIKRYLTNPIVAGFSTLNGEVVGRGDWKPIVDPEQWESVRALLTARTRKYVPRVSVLNGLIFCGKCGTRLITSSAKRTRTYRCSNRPGIDGCGRCSGNAEPIEEIAEAFAKEKLLEDRTRKRISELRAEPSGTQAELAALELRISELEQELDDPGIPVATITRAIQRGRERQGDLLQQLAARNLAPLPASADEWPEDITRRRALIDLVVERIELNPATKASRLGFDSERVVVTERT